MSELKVFISDDEQPARERLRTLLEDIAAELPTKVVGEARNGVEAIELLPPSGAQVLLLDIQMPGLDGFSVLSHLAPRATQSGGGSYDFRNAGGRESSWQTGSHQTN